MVLDIKWLPVSCVSYSDFHEDFVLKLKPKLQYVVINAP